VHELILKEARECHTKAAWENWAKRHSGAISSSNNSKLLEEIFKLLCKDPLAIQFGTELWASLLEGCLSSWNLELGRSIADKALKIRSPLVILPAAKVYLEAGFPGTARQIISKAQRLTDLETRQKVQLDIVNCSAYIEEGKRSQAARILARIAKNVYDQSLHTREKADFLTYVARTNFLLGRYKEASRMFEETSVIYQELQMWESTAKGLFNAAASLENAGEGSQEFTFSLVERCRRLSEEHDLKGPLAHCEAFYGHNDYWRGNFAGAREHYRRALQHIPASDKSYRRLHLLSMLAFTYLRTGRYHLVKKFGQQTLDLASLEETDRFAIRYDNLEAEILCEQGLFLESQALLKNATATLLQKGVHTLEDLAIMCRYIFQSCLLNDKSVTTEFNIAPELEHNQAAQLENLHATAHYLLMNGDYDKAADSFRKCIESSKAIEDQYHRALGYLGLVEVALAQNNPLGDVEELLAGFEIYAGRMVETPLKARSKIILAAIAYRKGDFSRCAATLTAASKLARLSYVDRFCINTWLSTIEGKATRFPTVEHEALLARMTRIYFGPTIRKVKNRSYQVAAHYMINLDRHAAIDDLFQYLSQQGKNEYSLEELQKNVWSQSINQLGWQQKIRNTINRLRGLFPYTMAPLIIHDKSVRLFTDAIEIDAQDKSGLTNQSKIIHLLRQAPQSSQQVADHLRISPATAKRLLKQLTEEDRITPMKIGRRVYYQNLDSN